MIEKKRSLSSPLQLLRSCLFHLAKGRTWFDLWITRSQFYVSFRLFRYYKQHEFPGIIIKFSQNAFLVSWFPSGKTKLNKSLIVASNGNKEQAWDVWYTANQCLSDIPLSHSISLPVLGPNSAFQLSTLLMRHSSIRQWMLGCRHTVSLDQDLQRIFLNLPGWEHSCCWSQVWAEFKKQKLIWDQRLEPETACRQVSSSHIFSHFSSINLFVSWIKIQQSGWWETLLGQESCFHPIWMGKWKTQRSAPQCCLLWVQPILILSFIK